MSRKVAAVVLAAGKGTRMRSSMPKVLHPLLGRPLARFPLDLAAKVADPVVAVLGHEHERVKAVLPPGILTAIQLEQRGTADAVRVGIGALDGFQGMVLVLSGDVPLLSEKTVEALLGAPAPIAVVVATARDPFGYGRVVRSRDGRVERIVEERDATGPERQVREINAGIYRFDIDFLRQELPRLSPKNAQGELYLTDLVAHGAAGGVATITADIAEVAGINDRSELAAAAEKLRRQVNEAHMRAGVTLVDPACTYIDMDVRIEADVTVEPGCYLIGKTSVAAGTTIRAFSILEDAVVGPQCILGPFARLRPGTVLAEGVHLGNFVETKNTRVGAKSKANHLSYLGDADIGDRVNVGAGTITCNYDGVKKHKTRIEDGAFIGSDTQLVAPVTVGEGAYVGAGTTVTKDVPADSLVFTRAPATVKAGWAKRRKEH